MEAHPGVLEAYHGDANAFQRVLELSHESHLIGPWKLQEGLQGSSVSLLGSGVVKRASKAPEWV